MIRRYQSSRVLIRRTFEIEPKANASTAEELGDGAAVAELGAAATADPEPVVLPAVNVSEGAAELAGKRFEKVASVLLDLSVDSAWQSEIGKCERL